VAGILTDTAQLGAFAKELGLTGKARLFCEALAADPGRNQSGAAERAGYSKPHRVQGSKVVTRGNVQKYLAALT
jgi:phage terminase small subunit